MQDRDRHQEDFLSEEERRLQEERRLYEEERRLAVAQRRAVINKAVQVVYSLTAALGMLLFLRVFLSLFGANRENAFAKLIYNLSNPFVAPFNNLFGTPALGESATLEINVLVAIGAYALLSWLVARFIVLVWSEPA